MYTLTAEVLEILSQLDDSVRDLPEARTLPPAVYTSDEFYRFEFEAIFAREWLCLGHVSQIPNAGDYFTVTVGPEPLVVTRDEDLQVHVVSGICQHRGFPLTSFNPKGNVKSLRCPYHYWSYGLDGRLVAAPEMQKTCDLGHLKRETRLPPLAVEIWNGLIFANMNPDAPPLAPTVEKLDRELHNFHFPDMVAMDPIDYPDQPWNWKGMHENALEPYHTQFVHRGYHDLAPAHMASFLDWDEEDGQVMHPTHFIHIDGGFNPTGKALFPVIETLSERQRSQVTFASIPPTAFFALLPDQAFVFLVLPSGAQSITLRIVWLFPRTTLQIRDFEWRYDMQTASNDVFNQQDIATNTRMQMGQRSRFAPRGHYCHQEETLPQFNRWLVKRYGAYAKSLGMTADLPMADRI
jgi:phenylpropionate dioxygenase-like ring-hydroxylating dioxygenase large terminal subunit